MLNRLKRRFILINMLSVSLVVLFIFGAICVTTYRRGREEIDRSIRASLSPLQKADDGDFSIPKNELPGAKERQGGQVPQIGRQKDNSYVFTVAVTVTPDGTVHRDSVFSADMEDETLQAAVEQALASGKTSGDIRSLALTWEKEEMPFGVRIVFASTDLLFETVRSTALISGAVCLASLLFFFLISYLLAGRVIRPVQQTWEQQKRFVADASHDLKTPLTVILANAGILRGQESATVGEEMQWVDGIAEEAERMRGLVDRMLELAKSENARQDTVLAPASISDLIERVILQFEPVAFERGVEIDGEIAEGVTLPSEEESFVRLVHILLDNAVKYSPVGERVGVTLRQTRTGAVLSVKNMGTPISPEDLPHLFERFYRADHARSAGGYGLGLSIAQNLARSLHARLSVTSSEAEGTVFTLHLNK